MGGRPCSGTENTVLQNSQGISISAQQGNLVISYIPSKLLNMPATEPVSNYIRVYDPSCEYRSYRLVRRGRSIPAGSEFAGDKDIHPIHEPCIETAERPELPGLESRSSEHFIQLEDTQEPAAPRGEASKEFQSIRVPSKVIDIITGWLLSSLEHPSLEGKELPIPTQPSREAS